MPIYLKLDGVTGKSHTKGHVGWIELTSLSSPSFKTNSKDTSGEISAMKRLDATYPTLKNLVTTGAVQPGTVDLVDRNGSIYVQLQLKDVMITSHSVSSLGGGVSESFTMHFAKMTTIKFSTVAEVADDVGSLLHDLFLAPIF